MGRVCPLTREQRRMTRRERLHMKNEEKKKDEKKHDKHTIAEAIRELARRAHSERKAKRASTLGRWAPVMSAMENAVRATFDVAEEAVRDVPRKLAKVKHVRRAATARFAGDLTEPVDLSDVVFTVGLLVQLAEDDFGEAFPDALLSRLTACPFEHVCSAFARF
jgi:hypothetical protein